MQAPSQNILALRRACLLGNKVEAPSSHYCLFFGGHGREEVTPLSWGPMTRSPPRNHSSKLGQKGARGEHAGPLHAPRERLGRESHSRTEGAGRALTFTLPPESGPNSAILLNILSYGRSRRRHRQGKRPRPAGSPLPSETRSSRAGPGGRFLGEGGRLTGARKEEDPPTTRSGWRTRGPCSQSATKSGTGGAPETRCAGATSSPRTRRAAGGDWAGLPSSVWKRWRVRGSPPARAP